MHFLSHTSFGKFSLNTKYSVQSSMIPLSDQYKQQPLFFSIEQSSLVRFRPEKPGPCMY